MCPYMETFQKGASLTFAINLGVLKMSLIFLSLQSTLHCDGTIIVQVVANRIIGKSSEQIRAELNLADDFTEEERAQIKKENEWGRE